MTHSGRTYSCRDYPYHTGNDGYSESVFLFFGPTFIPQGFGTHRSTSKGKLDNFCGVVTSSQKYLWDGAGTQD